MIAVYLEDAIEAVLCAMVTAVESAKTTDTELAKCSKTVRGDRIRPVPNLPVVWIVSEPATVDGTSPGLAERWTMPVRVAGLVANADVEAGSKQAVKIACGARRAILANRRLSLAYVADVVSAGFDMAARHGLVQNRATHWVDVTLTVHFTVRES